MANVGSGAAGKTLIGAGNGASPTYASIGTNSGLAAHGVLLAQGNSAFNVASPSTSGQVLTATGASSDPSFQSLPAQSILNVTGVLTSSQIKTLHSSPIILVAAQGSGKLIQIVNALFKMNYGGNNAFTAGASQTVVLSLGTVSPAVTIVTAMTNATIVATQNELDYSVAAATSGNASTTANANLYVYNPVATEISGNASNDNTMTYYITYYVL